VTFDSALALHFTGMLVTIVGNGRSCQVRLYYFYFGFFSSSVCRVEESFDVCIYYAEVSL
jgi:hypothetical protein